MTFMEFSCGYSLPGNYATGPFAETNRAQFEWQLCPAQQPRRRKGRLVIALRYDQGLCFQIIKIERIFLLLIGRVQRGR
jgi:hypothetical protein